MNKRFVRNAAITLIATAALSTMACGTGNTTKKPVKPVHTAAATNPPGKALERLESATFGEPKQVKPNAGAMVLCDDNHIQAGAVNTAGAKITFKALGGAAGEDCVVRVSFDYKHSLGMTMAMATPRSMHVSGLFAQTKFATGPTSFADIKVPDDSSLAILYQNSMRPAGLQAVTNKNEEPNSRAFQVANVPVYRQLVGTK